MKPHIKTLLLLPALIAGLGLMLAGRVTAQTYTVLKTFGILTNVTGLFPQSQLVQAPDGTLYGTTGGTDGVSEGGGSVFKVQPDGTGWAVLKLFTNSVVDGEAPKGGLVLGGSTLYGTTDYGGSGGGGTVFKLNTDGSGFTVLYSFPLPGLLPADGASPLAGLILSGGTLYGTTSGGGAFGSGTVFRMNTDGSGYVILKSFNAGINADPFDGGSPQGRLLLSGSTLYGTAAAGGTNGYGMVFALNTDGTAYTDLHDFSLSTNNGQVPKAGLVLSGGRLYGTTEQGGSFGPGTVFALNTDGTGYTNLLNFTGGRDTGGVPQGDLVLSGNTLYGTTLNGGNGSIDSGQVFAINTDGTGFRVVSDFTYTGEGQPPLNPHAGLILNGDTLYGTTLAGGRLLLGTVFKVNTNGTGLTILKSFGFSDGVFPYGGLVLSGGTLYGTTTTGGNPYGAPLSAGSIFMVNTDGTSYATLKNFTNNLDGADPAPGLALGGNTLYGIATASGIGGAGVVFKMNPDGTGYTVLYGFSILNGSGETPKAALLLSGSTLYGTAAQGGSSFQGSVFKVNTNGGGFTTLHSFTGTPNGSDPEASVTLSGNTLYGTTLAGGTAGKGTVFKVNTDGTGFTNLYSFTALVGPTNSDGAQPQAGLVVSGNTLYGTAYAGGTNGYGTIFALNTDGSGFKVLKTFSGGLSDGANPQADLILSGRTLYGTTKFGGTGGTVFALKTDGSGFTVLKSFSPPIDGANPYAGLLLNGRTLYGTTSGGGTWGEGTVFSLALGSFNTTLEVTTTWLPDGTNGSAYSQTLGVNGGQAPYSWTTTAGALPGGLTLATNGVISGTPTTNGTFSFTVRVTDALSATAAQALVLQVHTLDTTPPTLNITNVTAGLTVSNAVFTVKGTAGDDVAVAGVYYYSLNSGGWSNAMTLNNWANWTAPVTLTAGTNTISAYAVDTSGNVSTTNTVQLFCVLTPPWTVLGFTNLHSFVVTDGLDPFAGVILLGNTLYGTTFGGGSANNGTVFAVGTNGTGFRNPHIFSALNNKTNSDGAQTYAGLVQSGNTLYGTMYEGGSLSNGTVFAVNTDGTDFRTVYTFSATAHPAAGPNSDGAHPHAGLILSGNTLYGTAEYGGTNGDGTIFAVNTNGTGFTNLHSFGSSGDGILPQAGLVLSGNTLYGTTYGGGGLGEGTVFAVNTDGTGFTNLHTFTPVWPAGPTIAPPFTNTDGATPQAGLVLSGNTLYGTASSGGSSGVGTVFAVNTDGTGFTTLYNFTALSQVVTGTNSDGANPQAGLVLSRTTLFGTAELGGGSGYGSVFAINTDGTGFTVLHTFMNTGGDGADPLAGMILSGNTLYGTTAFGGIGAGMVFSITLGAVSAPSLMVTTTSLPNGTSGAAYNQTLTASGGQTPYSWTNVSESLPPGLVLSAGGVLSGTPTTNGTFNFTAKVTDSASTTATQALTLTVTAGSYSIATAASPSAGGVTSGDGTFAPSALRMVTAAPNSGYGFVHWTENGIVVSTSASYSFTLTANRNLVAVFALQAPGAVTLIAPANKASLSNRQPDLIWSQSVPPATWFRLYVARNQTSYVDQWIEGATNWMPTADLPAGSYSWWVEPYNTVGLGPWSTNASFTIPLAVPGTLVLVSPTSGNVVSSLTQLYTWQVDPAAVWYELYVVQNGKVLADQWFTLSNSVAQSGSGDFAVEVGGHTGGSYQWWVRGWGADGLGPWSSMGSYTMTPVPSPGPVTLLTPTNNANVLVRQPAFTWTASSPAASWYDLYVVRNGSKYLDQWLAGTTNWVTTSGLPGGTYTWYVHPWNEVGYGPWSTNFTFTIQTVVPSALTLVSPSGSVAAGSIQRYTWKADAAATWYELYVVRNGSAFADQWNTLTNSVVDSATGDFAVDVNGHSAGTYQWWVRGWGPDGLGPWSSSDSFTVQAP